MAGFNGDHPYVENGPVDGPFAGSTFGCPDVTTFCRLDQLGLVVVGQRLEPDRAVLACRVLEAHDGTEG